MMNDNNSVARVKELEEKVRKLEEKVQVLEKWKESVERGKLLEVESTGAYQRLKADMEFYKVVAPRLDWIRKMWDYMFSEEFRQQFLPRGSFKPRCYVNSVNRTIIRDVYYELNPEDYDFEIKFIAKYNENEYFRYSIDELRSKLPNWFYSMPSEKLTKEFIFDNLIVGVIEPRWKKYKHYDVVRSKLREYFTSK